MNQPNRKSWIRTLIAALSLMAVCALPAEANADIWNTACLIACNVAQAASMAACGGDGECVSKAIDAGHVCRESC